MMKSREITTLGNVLRASRDGTMPPGWIYLPEVPTLALDTACMYIHDNDEVEREASIPVVARDAGFPQEGLNDDQLLMAVEWASLFQKPPSDALILEGFVYYRRYDAFPERPGVTAPRGR